MNEGATDKHVVFQKMICNAMPLLDQVDHSILFFKFLDFTYSNCNDRLVNFSRLNTKKRIIGYEDKDLPWAEDWQFYRGIDTQVLAGKSKTILMDVRVASGERIAAYQQKIPIYDPSSGDIIGLMVKMQEHRNSIANSFISIKNHDTEIITGITDLPKQYLLQRYSKYGLTFRESECLFYLTRGMTVNMIAKCLAISPRTVEKFVSKLKTKLNCHSKSELLNKMIQDGSINIIPPGVNFKSFRESVSAA